MKARATEADASETHEPKTAADLARPEPDASSLTQTGRTDAVSAGIVRSGDMPGKKAEKKEKAPSRAGRREMRGASEPEPGTAETKKTIQHRAYSAAALADGLAGQAGESDDEGESAEALERSKSAARSGRSLYERVRSKRPTAAVTASASEANKPIETQKARERIRGRRAWSKAREIRAAGVEAEAASATRTGAAKKVTAAVSLATAPVAGVLAGALCFILAALLVSQVVSSIFGFWKNEQAKQSVEGLPAYITTEMVEAALECQEKYGHPAGCTLAQIIVESDAGDHLSGLATRDNNLFGIKWASSFAGAPEVAGKSSWSTREEYGGETVSVMANFTSFKSMRDCILFRSRVLLQNGRYANNGLIRQAISEHDSDKMAEGLKDAGYATSSDYVDSLKSAMDTYGLRRFDSMTLDEFKNGAANGNAIVDAAYSQLGVPYVWGGSTPNVGLDCSGLTQYCYARAGISIPHYSESQASGGKKIPLSQARPGDILWRPGHVAIYIGGDEYIHEPHTGDVCRKASRISYFTCAIRY